MALRVLTVITILLTFMLINLGGYVHNTGSSLACPDWPLCYGQVMPRMEGGILIEHSHRLLATLVGFLTIFIAILGYKKFKTSSQKWFGPILLLMVITQGILGGLTVIFKLPTIISTTHLGLSMIYFLSLIYFHHKLQLADLPEKYFVKYKDHTWGQSYKTVFLIILGLVYFQILLGALMRHLGLGGACGFGWENSLMCFDTINMVKTWLPTSSQAQIHIFHRYFAIGLGLLILFVYGKFLKDILQAKLSKMKILFLSPLILVIVQIKLGLMTVASEMSEVTTMLHLGGAAFLIAAIWKSYLVLVSIEKTHGIYRSENFISDIISLMKTRLAALVILTAAMGLFLAPGEISFINGLIAILSTSMIVAGACVINCYIERDVDKLMNRTALRPLPDGRMQPRIALNFGLMLLAISFPLLYVSTNLLTLILGFIATIFYVFIYTPMKRKSTFSLFMGAIPGAIPPLMGWTSVTNSISGLGIVLFGILFIWQLPHFLAIALYYNPQYVSARIKTVPNTVGVWATKWRVAFYTIALAAVTFSPYVLGHQNVAYVYLTAIVTALFVILSMQGLFIKEEKSNLLWARRYFLGSIIYLPTVLFILIFFKS